MLIEHIEQPWKWLCFIYVALSIIDTHTLTNISKVTHFWFANQILPKLSSNKYLLF